MDCWTIALRRREPNSFPMSFRLTPGFISLHVAIGGALAALLCALILWQDPAGLGGLLLRAPDHPFPLLLLWFFSALTLGSVQLGTAIMLRFGG